MKDKFGGLDRIITRSQKIFVPKAFNVWPARSPGINSLGFSIWARLTYLRKNRMREDTYQDIFIDRNYCLVSVTELPNLNCRLYSSTNRFLSFSP